MSQSSLWLEWSCVFWACNRFDYVLIYKADIPFFFWLSWNTKVYVELIFTPEHRLQGGDLIIQGFPTSLKLAPALLAWFLWSQDELCKAKYKVFIYIIKVTLPCRGCMTVFRLTIEESGGNLIAAETTSYYCNETFSILFTRFAKCFNRLSLTQVTAWKCSSENNVIAVKQVHEIQSFTEIKTLITEITDCKFVILGGVSTYI